MKKKPSISIIIPMYNVEKYLRRCLDSVKNQTFTDWQAICVNDGSPDNSGEIAREYAKADKRFIVVDKENGGLSDARNAGLRYATGDYIMYLDSDDFIHPQTMELTYQTAVKKNADMVLFDFDLKFHNRLRKKLYRGDDISGIKPRLRRFSNVFFRKWNIKNILFHATEKNRSWHVLRPVRRHCYVVLALYRAELVRRQSFINGIIFEDFPWWVSLLLNRPRTVIIKLPLYFYMPNAASILNSSRNLMMVKSLACGLKYSYEKYCANATDCEFKYFNREFLWPFIITMMRKVRGLSDKHDVDVAKRVVADLYACGVCDVPCSGRAKKYRHRIEEFIK